MIGRNQFNRRSITGLETFCSYERINLTRFLEWLGLILGGLLIIGGMFLFILSLVGHHSHAQK